MIKLFVLLSIGLMMLSCEEDPIEVQPTHPEPKESDTPTWNTFLIEAGNHSANESGFRIFNGDTLSFLLSFDASALYQTVDPQHQLSWSKVLGFSDCGTHHHTNSARLVWRYNEAVGIELAGYTYIDGIRTWSIVDTIQVNDTIPAQVVRTENEYHIRTQNTRLVAFNRSCTSGGSYWLFPYFGGQEPAPQDVRVHIGSFN